MAAYQGAGGGLMLSAADAQSLADSRMAEARVLLDAEMPCGAYYLAGYAVELALKVVVAKQFAADVIPDKQFVNNIYTHDLTKLLNLAGLQSAFQDASSELKTNWGIAAQWSEASRYAMIDMRQATEIMNAVGDDTAGVVQWLKSHW